MKLTPKQQKFIEAYSGNATKAAHIAGYAHPRRQGARLLTNVDITKLIQDREKPGRDSRIASRVKRQEFWTRTMLNDELSMKDRLRASELLGRSEADFIERSDHRHAFMGEDGKPLKLRARVTFVLPGEAGQVMIPEA